jgi:hypothetical protein
MDVSGRVDQPQIRTLQVVRGTYSMQLRLTRRLAVPEALDFGRRGGDRGAKLGRMHWLAAAKRLSKFLGSVWELLDGGYGLWPHPRL